MDFINIQVEFWWHENTSKVLSSSREVHKSYKVSRTTTQWFRDTHLPAFHVTSLPTNQASLSWPKAKEILPHPMKKKVHVIHWPLCNHHYWHLLFLHYSYMPKDSLEALILFLFFSSTGTQIKSGQKFENTFADRFRTIWDLLSK